MPQEDEELKRQPEQEPALAPATDTALTPDVQATEVITAPEPTSSDASLLPRPDVTYNGTGNENFTRHMMEFAKDEADDLADTKLNIQTYLERLYAREQREYDALKEYQKDESLSPEQREIVNNRLKTLDYNQQTRDLQEQYLASLNDTDMSPEAQEARKQIADLYHQRQDELKEFRVLMQNSPEFCDNEHMERMRELETKLEKADGMEAQNAVKLEMAEEMRGFKRDLLNEGDKGIDKMLSFIERNRGNTVIQQSGMAETMDIIIKQRDAARGAESAEELENSPVITAGRPKTGGIIGEDEQSISIARAEVGNRIDNGKDGAIEPVRLDGGYNVGEAVAQAVPDGRTPEERAATAQLT